MGGRAVELSRTRGPDKHFPYRGGSLPFVATGARDSALPITLVRSHSVIIFGLKRQTLTHKRKEKPQ